LPQLHGPKMVYIRNRRHQIQGPLAYQFHQRGRLTLI
jgi:hypothetical protein